MSTSVLLAVDDDPAALRAIEGELSKRYGADYRIVVHGSPESALANLRGLRELGQPVALVLADLWMPSMTGVAFLAEVRHLHPQATKALLVDWGTSEARGSIVDAAALGQIDCHIVKPSRAPDEAFHQVVTELLAEWSKAHAPGREVVRVIGEQSSPRCAEVRDLLGRHSIPFRCYSSESLQGREMLGELDAEHSPLPVLALSDGTVLVDPTNVEAADAFKGRADLGDGLFDLVVVGAGPAGLAAAVYAASEGLRTLVVEREAIGGQAGTTSRIRNYLGFPRGISGSDLAARAYEQAWHFGASFHHMRGTTELRPGLGHHVLRLSDGNEVVARAVVVATGVSYRRLGLPTLEDLVGRGVFYGPAVNEAPALTGQPVFVTGGGNSAGQAAVHLAQYASQVTVLVRGGSLADSMSDYLVREIEATRNIDVRYRTEAIGGVGERRLEELVLWDTGAAREETVPAGGLFVLIGGEPRTEWLPSAVARDARGYVFTGSDVPSLARSDTSRAWMPSLLETSVPGVFAAGDVRHGSIKRVASAAGEGTTVVAFIHQHLSRETPQLALA